MLQHCFSRVSVPHPLVLVASRDVAQNKSTGAVSDGLSVWTKGRSLCCEGSPSPLLVLPFCFTGVRLSASNMSKFSATKLGPWGLSGLLPKASVVHVQFNFETPGPPTPHPGPAPEMPVTPIVLFPGLCLPFVRMTNAGAAGGGRALLRSLHKTSATQCSEQDPA